MIFCYCGCWTLFWNVGLFCIIFNNPPIFTTVLLCVCVCGFKGILRIKATSPGVVVIEGAETGLYLSMNEDGKPYASVSLMKSFWYKDMPISINMFWTGACFFPSLQSLVTDESYFLERMEENHYNTYQSQKHGENWYVGIKKNGKMKRGPRTHIGQKAIFFLPRQVDWGLEPDPVSSHTITAYTSL